MKRSFFFKFDLFLCSAWALFVAHLWVSNLLTSFCLKEATEFLHRVQNGGTLPLITSCSPGWIKFCEYNYPEMIDNLSTCKSPHQMVGAIVKSYYAEQKGIDPKDIYMVSVMPCVAKKYEKARL